MDRRRSPLPAISRCARYHGERHGTATSGWQSPYVNSRVPFRSYASAQGRSALHISGNETAAADEGEHAGPSPHTLALAELLLSS